MNMNTLTATVDEILPTNPIRVETALSRFPVHRLAKHGDIKIEVREYNESEETSVKWKVSYNSEYGQPGPLAYKLDTLILNRKIEDAPRPIPRVIRLGSLKEIAAQLELGGDTNKVKTALRQNASAFITAKIRYRRADGSERKLEADFTRYSVVFTGEELPDGRKADAVYIVLNDVYMQVINGAMTRPLDYDYLQTLPPAPQRFYELLSYQVYAAIKNDRPRAKVVYSEFCTYAPQTRHFDWERVRSQMNKIYRPHKKSGYIAKIDYEQTVDSGGMLDWIMFYQPGPKARAEYRAFAKRGGPTRLQTEPLTLESPTLAAPQPSPPQAEPEPPLVAELVKRGVSDKTAADLVRQHPADTIQLKIDVFDWLAEKQDKRIAKSPEGYLVKSIADDYKAPKGFISRADRDRQAEAKRQAEQAAAEERRRQQEEEARERSRAKSRHRLLGIADAATAGRA